MRAVWFERTGGAEALIHGERRRPVPGRGEVLVQLHCSAVNPSDMKKRAGVQSPGLEHGFVIPHSDGAGLITAVGEGVSRARIGERVWVYQAQYQRHLGTAAQYVAVPAARAAPLPEATEFAAGACLGIPAMTAHRCVFADGAVAGQTILVQGAAGRVGFYAAQLAKLGGARVIGTLSGAQDNAARRKIAEQAGCDWVVDYRREDWVEAVREFVGGGVDRIIEVEFGTNLAADLKILKPNGVIAAYASMQNPQPTLPFYEMMFRNITLRLVLVYDMPEAAKQYARDDINEHLRANRLQHRIAATYPLAECRRAHEHLEAGADGCIVLEIPQD